MVLTLLTLLALGGAMMLFSARPAAADIATSLAGCDQTQCFIANQTDCEASNGIWTASTTTCNLQNVEFPCGQDWTIEVNLVADHLVVDGSSGSCAADQFGVFLGYSMSVPVGDNFTNNGVFTNYNGVTNDGYFYNTGTVNNQGTFTNAKGTIVVVGQTVSFSGTIDNSGTFDNSNGPGLSGTLNNQGLFFNRYNSVAGSFDNPLGSVFTNSGTFLNPAGASITNTDGSITNQGGGVFDAGGSITNSEDGTITNDAGGSFNFGTTTNTAHINNYGTLDVFLETFNNNLGGGITNENGATLTVSDSATFNNNGVLANDAGATVTNAAGASFDNTVELDNYGAISNSGTLSNTGGEGVIYDYCGSSFTNTGTLTGNAIVGNCASTTTLSSSLNPSNFGQSVTFTATVSPTPTTGDLVTFYENGASIGAGHTNGAGQVIIYTSPSSIGSSSFWATFAGDVLYGSSVSNTVTQTVNPLLSYSGPAGSSATLTPSSGGYVAAITASGGSSLGQITLPSGTTIPTGTVTLTYVSSGANSLLEVSGATIPYPPGKTMTLLNSAGATSVCIVDSAQSPTSLQAGTCGASNLANSEAILQCNGEAYTYPGFATQTTSQTWPSGTPQSRTFTCTATTQNGLNYLQVSGLAYGTTIIDHTPPVLTVPSNIITHTPPDGSTAVVTFTLTATDSLDPSPVLTCSTSSGSTFPIGITTVNCTATDAAGNVATGSFQVTVFPLATPTITTNLSATSIIPAESFTDSATLQGATSNAGGNVIYTLYFNNGCTGFGDNLEFYDVTNGNVPSLTGETGTDLGGDGSYGLVATYSGDSSNEGATSACEPLTVGQAAGDSISAAVYPPGSTMGSSLTMTDTATLSGGYNPTGAIVYYVYYWPAGSTPGCDFNTDNDHLVYDTQVLVNGNGQYSTGPFTPTEGPGDYYWIAEYGGDSNNAAVSTTCGAEFQTFVVQPATPFILTILTADNPTNQGTITLGGSSSDTGTFQGGYQVTGTLVFSAYASTSCTGTPAFTSSTITVNGDGPYTSSPFTPSIAGTYSWQATYSGDANNNGATSACGGPGETLTVVAPSLTLTPQSGGPGTIIQLTGGGLNPSSTYAYCYEQNYDSSPYACPAGSAEFTTGPTGSIPINPEPTLGSSGTSNGAVIVSIPGGNIVIGVQFDLIPLTTTSVSVSCSPSPVAIGSQSTCTGTVSGLSGPTVNGETLTFDLSGSGDFASLSEVSCLIFGDSCSVNLVGVSVGSITIGASYGGDTTFAASSGSTTLSVTQETLTISPQTGPAGSIITLSGGSYSPSSTYLYCYEPNYNSEPTACPSGSPTFTTDASGNIPTTPAPTLTASGTSNGAVIITDSQTGRFPIGVQFDLVFATLSISPTYGLPGNSTALSGSQYVDGQGYGACLTATQPTIGAPSPSCLAGSALVDFTASSTGAVSSVSVTIPYGSVPYGTPGGTYYVVVVPTSGVQDVVSFAPLTVNPLTPVILTTPGNAQSGGHTTLTGSEFLPNTAYEACLSATRPVISPTSFVLCVKNSFVSGLSTSSTGDLLPFSFNVPSGTSPNLYYVVVFQTPIIYPYPVGFNLGAFTVYAPLSVTLTSSASSIPSDGVTGATFTAAPSGGQGLYTGYAWSLPSGLSGSGCTLSSPTCTVTSTLPGSYSVSVTVTDDGNDVATSNTVTLTVSQIHTLTSFNCTPSQTPVGVATTCIAAVAPTGTGSPVTPTGTVSFSSVTGTYSQSSCNLTPLPGMPVGSCSVQFTPSSGHEGADVLVATYNGDVQHQGSTSQFTLTATQRADTVSVTCAPSPVPVASPTTCTALVTDTSPGTPITPTGAVLFNMATSTNPPVSCSLTPVSTSAAEASCSIQIPTAAGQEGSYSLVAGYNGDVDHVTSSTQFTVTVTKAASSVAVSCSPSSVTLASSTTCTALVSGVSVTGSVTFTSSSSTGAFTPTSGVCSLTAGSCSVAYSDTTIGAVTITGTYSGDSNNFGSSSTTGLTMSYKSCPQVTNSGGQNLKGANLEYCNLSSLNMSGDNLQGANLAFTDLQNTNLKGANLQGANLNNANAPGADFQGANLQSATMTNAIITGDNFQGVNLQSANLAGDSASGADFQGANLQSASLSGGDFDHVNLQGANLHNSDMSNGDFNYANFQGANTQGANITGATFVGATNAP